MAVNAMTNQVYVANSASASLSVIEGASGTVTTLGTGQSPAAVAVDPLTNSVYIANSASGTVTVIDGATQQSSTIQVGMNPTALVVNPLTNRVYVATLNNVTVIDTSLRTQPDGSPLTNTTTSVMVGINPVALAINLSTNKVYVANQGSNTVSVIDGNSNIVTSVPVGAAPAALAINPLANLIFVANSGSANITVIDGVTGLVALAPAPGPLPINPPLPTATPIAVGAKPISIAVNPVTGRVFVANSASASLTAIDVVMKAGPRTSAPVQSLATMTIPVGLNPSLLVVNPITNQVFVANSGSASVMVVDGTTSVVTDTVATGNNPRGLVVNPILNRLYITNQGVGSVTVVDLATYTTRTVPAGSSPRTVAVNSATNKIYVGNDADITVVQIDGATGIVTLIPSGSFTYAVAVNPVMNKIYAANYSDKTVTVIDGIPTSLPNGTPRYATTTVPVGSFPSALAVNPITNKIYVANSGEKTVTVIDGVTSKGTLVNVGLAPRDVAVNPVTNKIYSANSGDKTVTVINGTTNSTVSVEAGLSPSAIAVNPTTNRVYVANTGDNTVTVIDGVTNRTLTIAVGAGPTAIVVNAISNRIFVANAGDNTVTAIDGATNETTSVAVGRQPVALSVNPVTNKIYVANKSNGRGNVTVIDGLTLSATSIDAGGAPVAVAVNPATNQAYVANSASANLTVISEQVVRANGLVTTPLPLNYSPPANFVPLFTSTSSTPIFTFRAGRQSPVPASALVPQGCYYQINTWQGAWTKATDWGTYYSRKLDTLLPGYHILYACATDNQVATLTQPSSPLMGNITAYCFLVTSPAVATYFSISAPATAQIGGSVLVTVTALDAKGNPDTAYTGTVRLTSTDPACILQSDAALSTGTGTFSATFQSAGNYMISAVDTASSAISGTSGWVTVSGYANPGVVIPPKPVTVNTGGTTALWAVVQGTPPFTYRWSFKGAPIPGADGPLLLLRNASAANVGAYSVAISNNAGSVVTSTVSVALNFGAEATPARFLVQPTSQTVAAGSTVVFRAEAGGEASAGPVSYQWFRDGAPFYGGVGATCVVPNATEADAGKYTCFAINAAGVTESHSAVLAIANTTNPGRLVNLSCRTTVDSGANQLVVGYVVGGRGTFGSETLLLRASGPALTPFGVTDVLAEPQLALNNDKGGLQTNSGWAGDPLIAAAAASVGAFPWSDPTSRDAAIFATVPSGAYTAQISGAKGGAGLTLVEVYDATPTGTYKLTSPRLINISARVQVGAGGNVFIAGFVVGGTTARTVLIRASGPALKGFGLTGVLPDPSIQLFRSNGDGTSVLLQSNEGWAGDPRIAATGSAVGAFSWGTAATLDAAVLVTLPPGAYTAQLSGASGSSGLALVEVYEVP
jgi:YVTN family beta-propeller protein